MRENIFCVDIGGSKLICGALNQEGELLESYSVTYGKHYDIETILKFIFEGYNKLKQYNFSSCGVAVPGLCDYTAGKWIYSPFSKISDIPIASLIKEMTKLPTFADNDVNVSALAEKHFGACRDISDFLWITVSNGIGGGLFLDNKLYRGKGLSAGEIGHFIVEENGRKCGCGNEGCLEAYSSGAAIASIYGEKTGLAITAKEIAQKARSGDKTALTVWHEAGEYLGRAISYAVNLLNVDTVVLGGGAAEAFDLLEPSAAKVLSGNLFAQANPNVKIVHSLPGKYAALKGCVALVIENQKEKNNETNNFKLYK